MNATRSRRFAPVRIGLSIAVLISMVWNVSFADVLVLRNGGRIEGTLANREVVAGDPFAFSYISFLLLPANRTPELLSFDVAEVDYVLLDTEGGSRVIDFRAPPSFPRAEPQAKSSTDSYSRNRTRGIALIGLGFGLAAVSFVIPFGSEDREESGYGWIADGRNYNEVNYALLIAGGLSILTGLTLIARSQEEPEEPLSVWSLPRGAGLKTSWDF
jgi:hypothetical protein